MEKQSVEDSFRRAFQEAEIRPSADVWTHIELGIEKDAGSALRKSVIYYRWMAAASVLLAISLLGVGYLTMIKEDRIPQNSMALNEEVVALPEKGETAEYVEEPSVSQIEPGFQAEVSSKKLHSDQINNGKAVGEETVQPPATPKAAVKTANTFSSSGRQIQSKNRESSSGQITQAMAMTMNASDLETNNTELNEKEMMPAPVLAIRNGASLPPLVNQPVYQIHFPKTEPNQIDLLLASIEMEEKELKKERDDNKETLWTSVAMAAGAYNPVNTSSSSISPAFAQSGGGVLNAVQASGLSNQVGASGSSFSSGLSVGGKIATRWTLQGGVNYLTQSSSFSSNAVLVDAANKYSLASLNTVKSESFDGAFQVSNPYTISNKLQYFNIPLQAGYLFINKAFGWQIQGGISTDFFLQNTLTADLTGLNKISQSGGDDSPYRTINFSGLLGTEVSYRIGDHYRIAINPGLRYPLQSVYKSELGVSSTPVTFDVGLKFHYIFK